ncbi:MAG TPA: hypothetical protein VGI40_18665, partial [Pirellulaceae bacterium]
MNVGITISKEHPTVGTRSNASLARQLRRRRGRKHYRPQLEQLEDRRLLAVITPVSFTAGDHEVNHLSLTADADWLTYNEDVPHGTIYLGAFNPDFLKSLQVTFTGNTNDHLTEMPITGDIEGLVAGLEELEVEAPLGVGVAEGELELDLTASLTANGHLVLAEPNGDLADETSQVDVSFSLLDAIRRLPDGTAIVPLSAASVAQILAIPTEIASDYTAKAALGAGPDLVSLAALEAILAGLGIGGAIAASSGDVTVDVGDQDDTVDLSTFVHNATILLGDGNDSVTLGLGNDTAQGGNGDDTFILIPTGTTTTKTLNGGNGADMIQIDGTPGDDIFTFAMGGVGNKDLIIKVSGDGPGTPVSTSIIPDFANQSIEQIVVTGDFGDDKFIVDDSHGAIPTRLTFQAGGGEDSLQLVGDPGANGFSVKSENLDFGSVPTFGGIHNLVMQDAAGNDVTQTIIYDGFDLNSEFIEDSIPGPLQIQSNYSSSTVLIGGSTESTDPDNPDFASIAVGVYGPIKFKNKTKLVYNGGIAGDGITIDAEALSKSNPTLTSFIVNCGAGDDSVDITTEPGPNLNIIVNGNGGDDALSGDVELHGGDGDDILTGGDGDNLLDGGPGDDQFDGGGGADTYLGGDGFDTILISGDQKNNQISVSQTSATLLARTVDGVSKTDSMPNQDLEDVRIDAGAGDDFINVQVADSLEATPDTSLRFDVDGDGGNDRLIVQDLGLGDFDILRPGADNHSGSVTIGSFQPVIYQDIQRLDITPIDSVSGGTGTDGLGRLKVFHPDPFEYNDTRLTAGQLQRVGQSSTSPTIDPGAVTTPFAVNGDEDWYEFRPAGTGTFQVKILFDKLATLDNGRPGLPGSGDLNLDIYDANGTLITSGVAASGGKAAVFGATNDPAFPQFNRIYVRVRGATPTSINLYDFDNIAGLVSGNPGSGVSNVDTFGPQVTNVQITGSPAYNLFGQKPGDAAQGPTPAVRSVTISLQDLPNRAPGYLYNALDPASATADGNYVLKGDNSGIIPIQQIILVNNPPVLGQTPTATVQLVFASPLPDDRFTLTVNDNLTDPANNKLDGESNAAEPNGGPSFPSGDGHAGGNFISRFTVDSRPEIGNYSAGSAFIDINGNDVIDPQGNAADATNRDLTFQIGTVSDALFAGKFEPAAGAGVNDNDGFDKLGAYGYDNVAKKYRFLLDFNHDGIGDLRVVSAFQVNGTPVAGNFAPGHNGDEIGLFDGKNWYLDNVGDNQLHVKIPSNMRGQPIVGDFNGDG